MKLNDQIPGLPEWPAISKTGKNEYCVEGKHVSYRRYVLSRWILRLAVIGSFILLARHEFRQYKIWDWQIPASILIAYLIAYIVVLKLLPWPRWFCWLFLRRHTRVYFSRQNLVVNNKKYDLASNVGVQFRANRAPLSPEDCGSEDKHQKRYLLGFRIIEMIYGHRIVPIASVEYEDRANQFVVALQYAYERSQTHETSDHRNLASGKSTAGEWLPE